eukprot:259671_1
MVFDDPLQSVAAALIAHDCNGATGFQSIHLKAEMVPPKQKDCQRRERAAKTRGRSTAKDKEEPYPGISPRTHKSGGRASRKRHRQLSGGPSSHDHIQGMCRYIGQMSDEDDVYDEMYGCYQLNKYQRMTKKEQETKQNHEKLQPIKQRNRNVLSKQTE